MERVKNPQVFLDRGDVGLVQADLGARDRLIGADLDADRVVVPDRAVGGVAPALEGGLPGGLAGVQHGHEQPLQEENRSHDGAEEGPQATAGSLHHVNDTRRERSRAILPLDGTGSALYIPIACLEGLIIEPTQEKPGLTPEVDVMPPQSGRRKPRGGHQK